MVNLKLFRSRPIIGALPLALMALAFAQDGILLRRELKNDATDQYTMSLSTKQVISSPAGDQDVTVDGTMKMAFKTTNVSEKHDSADLTITVSDMDLKLGGMAQMAEGMMGTLPKSYTVKGKVDNRNQVTNVKLDGLSMQQQMMAAGVQSMANLSGVAFPENPVKVGDTWDVPVPKNEAMGTEASVLKATLVGEKKQDGIDTWEISLVGKLPVNMDLSKLTGGNDPTGGSIPDMKVLMKGTNTIKATLLVEKSSGRTISMDGNLDSDQNIDLPDMGMTMTSKGATKALLKLAK